MLRLTISPTQSGPGHHCSEAASQVHTSRAAGSLATSPGPSETFVHIGGLWARALGQILGPPGAWPGRQVSRAGAHP